MSMNCWDSLDLQIRKAIGLLHSLIHSNWNVHQFFNFEYVDLEQLTHESGFFYDDQVRPVRQVNDSKQAIHFL